MLATEAALILRDQPLNELGCFIIFLPFIQKGYVPTGMPLRIRVVQAECITTDFIECAVFLFGLVVIAVIFEQPSGGIACIEGFLVVWTEPGRATFNDAVNERFGKFDLVEVHKLSGPMQFGS